MKFAVLALEVLGVLLIAAAAAVGLAELVGLWVGLLAAGVIVLLGAWRGDSLSLTEDGERGAAVRPASAPRR